jgi:hypothetical protein
MLGLSPNIFKFFTELVTAQRYFAAPSRHRSRSCYEILCGHCRLGESGVTEPFSCVDVKNSKMRSFIVMYVSKKKLALPVALHGLLAFVRDQP